MGINSQDRCARYEEAVQLLPSRLRRIAESLPPEEKERVEELRLRVGENMTALCGGAERTLGGTDAAVKPDDLETLCNIVTDFSRYAAADTLRQGYLTAPGGFRVGVCGTAVTKNGENTLLKDFSSMCLRISREQVGLAVPVMREAYPDGRFVSTLLIAPPGYGKTTLLRDFIRNLSDGTDTLAPRRVALVDERGEIACMRGGRAQMNVGVHTDVLDGVPKSQGMEMLLRTMNPEVIAVDEITVYSDLRAIARCANCGVSLLATVHAANAEELLTRPLFRKLTQMRVFRRAVCIGMENGERTYKTEEMP